MKINCPSCGAKYTIADDRVRRRKVKVRCKSCSTPIVVDGTEVPAAEASTEAASPTPEAAGAEAAPQAAGTGSDEMWSVNLSDTEQRDMTFSQIVAGWQTGEIPDDAFVWKEGMADWAPILEAPELKPHLPPRAVPPLGQRLSSPDGRRADVRPQETADLFGNVATAGSEEEQIATSAPMAGESSYVDHKPTGARNENSVLFSLDSLKAGMAPQGPVPAASAPRHVDSNDPFGMGGGTSLGSGPLFGAGSNQALLLTPPPPEPEPPKAFTAAPGAAGGGKAKLIAAIATGAALLMAVALVISLTGHSDDQEIAQAKAESTQDEKGDKASKSDKEKASDSEKTGEKEEAAPDKEAKADEKDSQGSQEKSDDTSKNADKGKDGNGKKQASASTTSSHDSSSKSTGSTSSTTSSTSSGSGSKTSSSTASTAPKVTVKAKPSTGVANFNKAAARTALANAAAAAPSCRRPGGPTGGGRALVTFAPSGRVTTATVTGAFAGTSVGGCIASLFRKARVPAFDGGAVTVSKSFSIQ